MQLLSSGSPDYFLLKSILLDDKLKLLLNVVVGEARVRTIGRVVFHCGRS